MKIQYCSDLHLEFTANSQWIKDNPIKPIGDILIIAGDTYYLGKEFSQHPFFDYISDHFEQSYLIPGNHEYYGGYDISKCEELDFSEEIRSNVLLLNNKSININDTQLIFSTMWSKIEKNIGPILGSLNDFRLIQYKGQKLNIEAYNDLFHKAWNYLQGEINRDNNTKKVVVTHHLPSLKCNLDKYKESKINEAFCIDLTKEIKESKVDYWIYGHSHGNKKDFKIGNTTMLTNQLGYIHLNENRTYKSDAFIEV